MSAEERQRAGVLPDSPTVMKLVVSTVTGQIWEQAVAASETVGGLKWKICQRTGLSPYQFSLIHGNASLPDFDLHTPLRDFGVKNNSLVRLVVMARSGPLMIKTPEKGVPACNSKCSISSSECSADNKSISQSCDSRMFDEHLDGNRRAINKMYEIRRQERRVVSSAPEDTSAKESSANDTECDDDTSCIWSGVVHCPKFTEASSFGRNSSNRRSRQTAAKDEATQAGCQNLFVANTARDRLLAAMQPRGSSPSTDVNTHSEDGSELSSGVIVCDLSNEFRRLRVRRKHHGVGSNATTLQRVCSRGKPRQPLAAVAHHHHHHQGSDVTSSDDERPRRRLTEIGSLTCATLRRPSTTSRTQKTISNYQSHQRCYACAVKLSSCTVAFQCRCGKTLCARHRAAGMHTCTRIRKLQDVSD